LDCLQVYGTCYYYYYYYDRKVYRLVMG